MLKIEHISDVQIYTSDWDALRCGRFTSSKMHTLMGEKMWTDGAMSYIYQKVGEFVTGRSMAVEDDIVEDENTQWGNEYESKALQTFAVFKGIEFLVTQKVITAPGSRFSSTPDGIWIINSSVVEKDSYNVASVEVKCPRKYPRFFPLYRCNTPEDLKKYSKHYFWQVIDQMDNCGAVLGYFVCFHPLFPDGKNMKIIEFQKLNLWDDFKFLAQRKAAVLQKFNEVLSEFI